MRRADELYMESSSSEIGRIKRSSLYREIERRLNQVKPDDEEIVIKNVDHKQELFEEILDYVKTFGYSVRWEFCGLCGDKWATVIITWIPFDYSQLRGL